MVGCFKLLLPAIVLLAVLGEIEEEVKVEKFGYLLQDNSDDSDSFDELDS